MTKFYIIHGTGGNPEGNWFPWLKAELLKLGHEVLIPRFPTPEGHNLENWLKVFDYETDEDTVFIGHSLGCAFILNLLEKRKAKGAVLVSGFVGPLGLEEFDPLNKSFTEREFDWKAIRDNCKHYYVINSDDDPYVPLSKGKELAEKLNIELIVMKNAGHINKESGFIELPLLLDILQEVNNEA